MTDQCCVGTCIPATAPSKKKKLLNEAELAARKTETAAKRKIHTEKKLEDDKVGLFNPTAALAHL